MTEEDELAKKRIRAYDQSNVEIVLRFQQYFENKKVQHRRICLNKVAETTAAARGVNKNTVCTIETMEDVLNWKKKPENFIRVPKGSQILENF